MDYHNGPQAPTNQQERSHFFSPSNGPSPTAIPEESNARLPPASATRDNYGRNLKKLQNQMLRALSKTFGHIPDIPIFTHWDNRKECCNSAVHRPVMAGICGNKRDGAFSISISGHYPDDEDGGDVIIYTGAGGREQWTNTIPPKRIRLGPQTMDQSWDKSGNQALMVSLHTGNPVRVIRSWKSGSQYSPCRGYRYDGLYRVAACWTAKGRNGKNICRCRLERLPGQPPIPVREPTIRASRRGRPQRLVSDPTSHPSSSNTTNPHGASDEIKPTPHPSTFIHPHGISEEIDRSAHSSSFTHPHGISDEIDIESETSTQVGEMDHDVKVPLDKHQAPIDPDALPRFSVSTDGDEEDEEVRRVEDDIAIFPADDDA